MSCWDAEFTSWALAVEFDEEVGAARESVGLDASVAVADAVAAAELALVAATLLSTDKMEGHWTIYGSVLSSSSKVEL